MMADERTGRAMSRQYVGSTWDSIMGSQTPDEFMAFSPTGTTYADAVSAYLDEAWPDMWDRVYQHAELLRDRDPEEAEYYLAEQPTREELQDALVTYLELALGEQAETPHIVTQAELRETRMPHILTLGEALRQVADDGMLVQDNAWPVRDPLCELEDILDTPDGGEQALSQPVAIVPGAIMALDEQGYQTQRLYTLVEQEAE